MSGRFTVLASGSSGNAALLETPGFGLLIDCGLHPRVLTARLREIGATWDSINAVLLSHTHSDHWKPLLLADLRSRKIPLYAHPQQCDFLTTATPTYEHLARAGLICNYRNDHVFALTQSLSVRPIQVSHDSDPTFAFRIDLNDAAGLSWSVGYASDLGCGSVELIEAFAGVDVLALEYNHDLTLEQASRRPRFLVDRVLSNRGHLSNSQAAELTRSIVKASENRIPHHLVQLHLSRECNRPELSLVAGQAVFAELSPTTEVVVARQDTVAKSIVLHEQPMSAMSSIADTTGATGKRFGLTHQPPLPGFET